MRTFFDTNILVYLFDADADDKKARASARFETEVSVGRALLSTQVLQEFYVVVTRKLSVPLEPETAEAVVRNLSLLPVIGIDAEKIIAAIGRCQKNATIILGCTHHRDSSGRWCGPPSYRGPAAWADH